MGKIIETFNGIEIEPLQYSKKGSWKLFILGYKEFNETMLELRNNEVKELEHMLEHNPELADDESFKFAYDFSTKEFKKHEASIAWADVKISELPVYDPFL